nr:unnamed protein product [Digitaria exilis]
MHLAHLWDSSRKNDGRYSLEELRNDCRVMDTVLEDLPELRKGDHISCTEGRIHCSLNINTETGRLSVRTPNLQNQPALEKDRYKIRQAFVAAPGNSLIVADYGQLELRMLAHLTNCKSMLDAFKAGGDFHSRTAMNMYQHIRDAVHDNKVLLEWHPQPGQEKPPVPLLKSDPGQRGHIEHLIERAAINAPVQGSAADVVMCAMLEIERNARLKELGWRLLLQVHDEVILEGPSESAEVAKAIVVECMSKPFYGTNILKVDLTVDAKCSKSWYAAK